MITTTFALQTLGLVNRVQDNGILRCLARGFGGAAASFGRIHNISVRDVWCGTIDISGLITVHIHPVADTLRLMAMSTHEVVVNMIKPFGPTFKTLLMKFDGLETESTPETRGTVSSNATGLDFTPDAGFICHVVMILEVVLEGLATVKGFATDAGSFALVNVASKGFLMGMLRVLVTLPIILASKGLGTVGERTAIRLRVALHVFSFSVNTVGRRVNLLT